MLEMIEYDEATNLHHVRYCDQDAYLQHTDAIIDQFMAMTIKHPDLFLTSIMRTDNYHICVPHSNIKLSDNFDKLTKKDMAELAIDLFSAIHIAQNNHWLIAGISPESIYYNGRWRLQNYSNVYKVDGFGRLDWCGNILDILFILTNSFNAMEKIKSPTYDMEKHLICKHYTNTHQIYLKNKAAIDKYMPGKVFTDGSVPGRIAGFQYAIPAEFIIRIIMPDVWFDSLGLVNDANTTYPDILLECVKHMYDDNVEKLAESLHSII